MLFIRLAFFIVCFGIISCHFEKKQNSSENKSSEYQLVIYDSLIVENNSFLFLSDYDPIKGHYLFYDYFTGDILIKDKSGKFVSTLNYKGDGNTEYGELRGLSFFGQDKIIGYSAWNYYIFWIQGGFVQGGSIMDKSILVNPDYDFKAHHFISVDSTLYLLIKGSSTVDGNVFTKEFYRNIKWVSIYNPALEQSTSGVSIPTGSIYATKFYYNASPHFALDTFNRKLIVLYPFEPIAYIYDLPSLTLTETIPLKPDFFAQAKGVPFSSDSQKMKDDGFVQAQISGEYMAVQSLGEDMFLTYYYSGLPYDNIAKDMSTYMSNDLHNKRGKYLQIFHANKKKSKDIKLPEGIQGLSIATRLDHIVLQADISEELSFSKYYICKLTAN